MPGITTNDLFQLAIFINHEDNGLSESWYLRDIDADAAAATAALLVEARSFVMAKGHVLEWAELRRHTRPRRIRALVDTPLEALPQWDYVDNDAVGLLFRFDTGDGGKFANHLIRGIDDGEITRKRWVRHPLALPPGIFPRPADPTTASKEDLWKYFLTLFREKCAHREILPQPSPGVDAWRLRFFEAAIFKGVKTRDFGSAYARVSAEWAVHAQAADFSFCGMPCTVQRTCRVVDAYAYSDAPVNHLRFYFAAPGATVFPHWHIYWGQYRDQEVDNSTAPGELTGPRRHILNPSGVWEWSSGSSFGSAPGLAFTGPPSRFLGLDPCPYDPDFDTPDELRPECDLSVYNLNIRDANPNTIDVADTRIGTFERASFLVTNGGEALEAVIDLQPIQHRGDLGALECVRLCCE